MPLRTLPGGDQVEHVHTFVTFSVFFAFFTAQLDAPRRKEGPIRAWVYHLDQPCVEVDLTRQCRNRHQACAAD